MKNRLPPAKFLVVQPLLDRSRQLTPGPAAEPDWGVWKAGPYPSSVLGDGCVWAGAAVVWSAGCMITWGCDGCGDVSGGAASDGSVSDGTVSGKTDGGTAGGACVGTGAGCAGAVVSRGALPEDWLDFLLSVPGRS